MKTLDLKLKGLPFGALSLLLLLLLTSFLPGSYVFGTKTVESGGAELGRGPHCTQSRGLCTIDSNSSSRQSGDGYLNVQFAVTASGGLSMSIPKTDISAADASYQFSGDVFQQEEVLDIPAELSQQLPALNSSSIPAGTYPVTENTSHYTIDFSTVVTNQSK